MLWALLASGTFSGLPGPWYPVRVPSPYTSRCILTLPFLSHRSSSDAPCPLAPSRGLTSHPGWDTDRWIPYDLSEDDWALKLYLPCLCAWLTRDGISHARMPTKTPTENFSVGGWWFWLKEQPPKLLTACFWVLQVVLAGGFLRAAGVASILYGTLLTTAGLGSQCPSHRSLHMLLKSP